MKDRFPVIKVMTKGDFLLIAGIVILVVFLFLKPVLFSDNLYGEIYLDSKKVHTVRFENVTQDYRISVGECELNISNDGITFVDSACPDKLCVNSGKLTKAGDTMACVPEKVVAVIKSDKNTTDAVSY